MEAARLCPRDDKENLPPFSASRIGPEPADVGPRLKKGVDRGVARKPLADVTHLFVGSSPLARSSSARASGGLSMLHWPSPHPKKRRALDDVDLLRVTAYSAKSLRMGFR